MQKLKQFFFLIYSSVSLLYILAYESIMHNNPTMRTPTSPKTCVLLISAFNLACQLSEVALVSLYLQHFCRFPAIARCPLCGDKHYRITSPCCSPITV